MRGLENGSSLSVLYYKENENDFLASGRSIDGITGQHPCSPTDERLTFHSEQVHCTKPAFLYPVVFFFRKSSNFTSNFYEKVEFRSFIERSYCVE